MLNMKLNNFVIEESGITVISSLRKNDIYLKRRYSTFIQRNRENSWDCCTMLQFSLHALGLKQSDYVFSFVSDHSKPLQPNTLASIFRKTLQRAGVQAKFTAMLLRKQAINKLSREGISSEECLALRGWSEKSSLQYYNVRSEAQQGRHSEILWDV